jgi:hypothetical protein
VNRIQLKQMVRNFAAQQFALSRLESSCDVEKGATGALKFSVLASDL